MPPNNIVNALSIDLEDWYQVSDFNSVIQFSEWSLYENRLWNNTAKILDLLERYNIRATFFVLAWNARRDAKLIKEIHTSGHEISSHGYGHQLIYRQAPSEFAQDLKKSIDLIEDITGEKVRGFRAPSFSITRKSLWALDILLEQGLQYDSSVFPIVRSLYGIPTAERFPHVIKRHNGKQLIEFPISTVRIGRWNIPFSGGAYLRVLPKTAVKFLVERLNEQGRSAIVYFHPWEIDPNQPRLKLPSHQRRTLHYVNLETTEAKVEFLLTHFRFAPIREVLSLA